MQPLFEDMYRVCMHIIALKCKLLGKHGSASLCRDGANSSISNQTIIFHLVVNSMCLRTVRSALSGIA